MRRLTPLLMGFLFFAGWRGLVAYGYPEGASVITASATVFALSCIHAFFSRGDSSVHPATVLVALAAFVLTLAAVAAILSALHPAMLAVLIIALAAPLLLYSYHRRVKEEWTKSGRCETCGYDLRASAERCPECNTPVPQDQLRRIRAEMTAARAKRAAPDPPPAPPPPPPIPPVS
jgi:hypothetical protein